MSLDSLSMSPALASWELEATLWKVLFSHQDVPTHSVALVWGLLIY